MNLTASNRCISCFFIVFKPTFLFFLLYPMGVENVGTGNNLEEKNLVYSLFHHKLCDGELYLPREAGVGIVWPACAQYARPRASV